MWLLAQRWDSASMGGGITNRAYVMKLVSGKQIN